MFTIEIISSLFRNFIIFLCSFFVFIKIINYKEITGMKAIFIIFISLLFSVFHYILMGYVSFAFSIVILTFIASIIMAIITRNKLSFVLPSIILSMCITFFIYLCVVIIVSLPFYFILELEYDNFITMSLTFIVVFRIFKIKRISNGFSFLNNRYINGISLFFIVLSLVIYFLTMIDSDDITDFYIIISIVAFSIGLFVWIKRNILFDYINKNRDSTIARLEERVRELELEKEKNEYNNLVVKSANHKINERFKALEEFAMDHGDLLDSVNRIKEEYDRDITSKLIFDRAFPMSGIVSFDNLVRYLAKDAYRNNIDFQVKFTGSVNYMVEKLVSLEKFETLVGDHVRNAILAMDSDIVNRRIFVDLGMFDDCYGVRIYDSGVMFEIDTLLALGLRPSTTRGDGGSGIGFMTTFEMMAECLASLVVTENDPDDSSVFTKCIDVRFDGRNDYVVRTYRAEEIRLRAKDDRVIIVGLDE